MEHKTDNTMAILNDKHTDPEVAQELDDKVVPKGLDKLSNLLTSYDNDELNDIQESYSREIDDLDF